ncbi:MAG TPA: hypothetical protein VFH51_01165 [Myxococcota bacterium]|nr:hypothetical protein [Myxococcota bacterium]
MIIIQMLYRGFLLTGCSVLAACSAPTRQTPVQFGTYEHDGLGLEFALPLDWVRSRDGMTEIFSGPPGTDSYFTTVALQYRSGPLCFDEALADAFAHVETLPHFVWRNTDLIWVDGHLALLYTTDFELADTLRRRTGLLLVQDGTLIDLSYSAPVGLFPTSVPIYQDMIDTLTLLPTSRQIAASIGPDL